MAIRAPAFSRIHTEDAVLERMQDAIEEALRRLATSVPSGNLPIGSRVTWQLDGSGIWAKTPQLPVGWVRLDASPAGIGGSVLHETRSPFHGETLPTAANTILRVF